MRRIGYLLAAALLVYLAVAYLALPTLWKHYEHAPELATVAKRTRTADGIPGDAINVALQGTREAVARAMHEAGWSPADPITFETSAKIVASVLLHRPDPDAPVSPLFYDGRKQDLAFEKLVGGSAKERNHVRFWALDANAPRPFWLGAATFDRGVGLSHTTGQVTHHIAPNIDAERDTLVADLRGARVVATLFQITGMGPTLDAHNGGGDRFFTDGEIDVCVLHPGAEPSDAPVEVLASPTRIQLKNQAWSALAPLMD